MYLRIRQLILISAVLGVVAGCSTSKEKMFPHDPANGDMLDVWNRQGSVGSNQNLIDARAQLRRPLSDTDAKTDIQSAYSRDSVNEIHNLFARLPNPDLVMYVYPHLAGSEQAPVPGYTTVFPLFNKVKYALPGERVEDY